MAELFRVAGSILASRLLGRPLYGRFHVTYGCNYSCRMCQIRTFAGSMRELGLEDIHVVAERLVAIGIKYLVITGGEPFLRHDLPQIVAAFALRGVSVRIQTNGGSQVTPQSLENCAREGLREISVSIDTLDAALQDDICQSEGVLDSALRTLSLATKVLPGGMNLANIVASRLNFDQLPHLVRFFWNLGIYTYITPVMLELMPKSPMQHYNFRGTDTLFSLRDLEPNLRDRTIDELKQLRRDHQGLTNSTLFLEDWRKEMVTGQCNWTCRAGKLTIDVLPDGGVSVCKEKPSVESILDQAFVHRYKSGCFAKLARPITSSCGGCFYGEYREPYYANYDLRTLLEWGLSWFMLFRNRY